jgi:hypothetical protein
MAAQSDILVPAPHQVVFGTGAADDATVRKSLTADNTLKLTGSLEVTGSISSGGFGISYFVNGSTGSSSNDGKSASSPKATITQALALAVAGDKIFVAPGEYDEAVTVARAQSNLSIIGLGARGSVFIAPSTADATAMTILADDVTIINVGCDGDGTGDGLKNYGRRTRAYSCKIEGGTNGLHLTLGTDAQITAGTHGKGDDCWWVDCEIAWNTNGVKITATDYGAVTQNRFRKAVFHDNTAADFEEAGGSVNIRFRDLDIGDCDFLRQEDGTEPTKYLSLNDDNGNTGVVHGCTFPSAINSGKSLVSTGLIWVGNLHTGGISTAQPS